MKSRVQALAKVNLGLYVLYRRPDDFHELRTVYQTISLADKLEIDYRRGRGPAVELECDRPELARPENLAARAARRLLDATGDRGCVRIRLEKRIPVGAGLGGGSSDAAAVLLALAARLRPRPEQRLLLGLAAELGSDVPFFLLGGRAVGVGRGTEIYPLPDLPRRWMLVVAPSLPVSTAEAYRRLSPHLTSASREDKIYRLGSSTFEAGLENDFERVVFQMHPELQTLKTRLMAVGARPALLCGSGSALFGVFRDRREAVRARDSEELAAGSCFVASTVSRAAYRARWRQWME
jgi:4-diphosphocytidyl-2-C-methyl-D-erythritol kinase